MSATWQKVRLGEVLTAVERPEAPMPGMIYRQLGVKLWGEGAYERESMDGAATKYAKLSRVEADDIVVNKIWARNGSVAVVQTALAGCFVSGEFPTFATIPDSLLPRWMHWLTKTPGFWAQCDEKSQRTSGKNRIKPEQFLNVEIPLPPLAEQRRIVARIEELSAKIAEARSLRQRAVEEADAFSASLLASLLPDSIETKPLADLIAPNSKISYGVLVPGPDVEGGVPFVRVQDLDIKSPPPQPNKRIAREIDAQYERTRLMGGEILLGVVGSIGKVGIAPASWAGANIARAVCRIIPSAAILRDYLAVVLSAKPCQDYFHKTTRTLAQPTLNIAQLAETPIPVPPLPEQRRIVTYLNKLQDKVDAIKQLQAETAAELDAMLPSILDKAFKGEL